MKRPILCVAATVVALLMQSTIADATDIENFVAKSGIDGTLIQGEIDLPAGVPTAIVTLVPGSGGFNRDARFGRSGTDADLIFKVLAARLTASGLAVVRFDERGRSCQPGAEQDAHGRCRDPGLIGSVSAESKVSDAGAVVDLAAGKYPEAAQCLILFAHSEGMVPVAKLVSSGRAKPYAIVGMGGLMESPASVYWWQRVYRQADSLRIMDVNGDGVTTSEEIREGWSRSPIGALPFSEQYLPSSGRLTKDDIDQDPRAWFELYSRELADAMAHPDSDVYTIAGKPVASYGWWKQWFTDWTPVASRLSNYRGNVRLFYGSWDSQTPSARQRAAAESFLINAKLQITVVPEAGHTLGPHPLYGPMSDTSLDEVVDAVIQLASACKAQSAPTINSAPKP